MELLSGKGRLISTILVAGLFFLSYKGCNEIFNNNKINKPGFKTVSYSGSLFSHVEFTRYSDGSKDINTYLEYSSLHASELWQDLDGNGKIDRIRMNGSKLKSNSLHDLLVRKYDYKDNKKRFDEADEQLRELEKKYPLDSF